MTICFFPASISAKTINVDGWRNTTSITGVVLNPGDILDFNYTTNESIYYLYLENDLISPNCFGIDNQCSKQIEVKEKMLYYRYDFHGYDCNYYFYKIGENEQLININDYTNEEYYQSGDILFFTSNNSQKLAFVYNENSTLIESLFFGNRFPRVYRLPKINGKNVYWKNSIYDDGLYANHSSHFIPIDYTEPKIELKCDKDKINYGEKTKCEVCIECTHAINKLEFSMNQKDLKFSNYSFSNGVTNSGNNNSIKLNITDNNICNEKKTIMTFDVESTKDTNYLDKITLKNLAYTDEILTGNYNDLDSNLNIISVKDNISNPKTGTRMIFIIIPIIILLIVGILSVFKKKNKATN